MTTTEVKEFEGLTAGKRRIEVFFGNVQIRDGKWPFAEINPSYIDRAELVRILRGFGFEV